MENLRKTFSCGNDLLQLDVWEVEAKFSFAEHQATNGDKIPLIKDWKDVLNKVGDNQVLLQSIKGSPYYNAFGDRATVWERKLTDLGRQKYKHFLDFQC